MAKLLLIVVGLFVAYWFLKGYRRKVDGKPADAAAPSEDMVRCAECGVHLPRSESLMSGSTFYCSADHRRIHEKAD